MKKITFISAAALLFLAACNPITIDKTYDIEKVDPTVTLVPGVTIQYEDSISFKIGELLGEATSDDSFLKAAGANDPLFDEGDFYFRQDGNVSSVTADGTTATFSSAMAVYMVDVPGMLNISNEYTLRNPCIAIKIEGSFAAATTMDVNLSIAGAPLAIASIPVKALAEQTVFISASGGYADESSESDFTVSSFPDLFSPLPYQMLVSSVVLKGTTDGVTYKISPSFVVPADFTAPSAFGSSLSFGGVKITPKSEEYNVTITSVSVHFVAKSTAPFDISIVQQPNDSVSLTIPTIKAGQLDAPTSTEGDIVLTYKDYTAISSLITDISASVTTAGAEAQLNSNQGLTLILKSITIPDGVEVEFLKKEEDAQ